MKESLFRPKILKRERVNKLLEAIFETPLFYLSASMGYGKTTAVKEFLESKEDVCTVWIPVSNAEGDENWLWHKFGEAIQKYNPDFAEKFLNLGFPNSDYEIIRVLELMKKEINREIVVVFDDYQDAKCQMLDRILKLYTDCEMTNVRAVVISRMRPPAEFLLLSSKGRCLLMWQGEIAFTKEETNMLFEVNGFELPEGALNEIYSYTMGWVAPTYLTLLEYATNQDVQAITESSELIKVAVYDQIQEDYQNVLMMLAPIEKFSLELGEYVIGNKIINDVIAEMMSNNCFINLIPQSKEYQFHTLFKHTLLKEFRRNELDEKEVWIKCGEWYRINGDIPNAIDYFAKAEQYEVVLDMMSEEGATEYVDIAPKLIEDIFEKISVETKLAKPIGYLSFIYAYLIRTHNPVFYKMLSEAKAYYEQHPEIDNWNHIMGEIYLMEAFTIVDQPIKVVEKVKQSYEYLNEGKSTILGAHMICAYGKIRLSSLLHHNRGEYHLVKKLVDENMGCFEHIANGCAIGMKQLIDAEYAYDIGELEEAKMFAHKAIYRAEMKKQISVIVDAYFILIRIALMQGKMDEVNQYIEEAEKCIIRRTHPIINMNVEMMKAYIYGISNQYEKMPEWCRTFDIKTGMDDLTTGMMGLMTFAPLSVGLALLHKKEYMQVEAFMENCIEEYQRTKSIYAIIIAYIILAVAKLKLYGEDEGIEALEIAFDIAEPDQIIMPFVEQYSNLEVLLKTMKQQSIFAKKIIEYNSLGKTKQCTENKNSEDIVKKLTDREKEVMRLFVKGYKQSEIAKELQITTDTVKRHIKNVYGKLEIHSKVELIEKIGQVIKD